jgi:hypothetical protein
MRSNDLITVWGGWPAARAEPKVGPRAPWTVVRARYGRVQLALAIASTVILWVRTTL